jgi:hypothetical protein
VIALRVEDTAPANSPWPILRVMADGAFEPIIPDDRSLTTFLGGVVDTGAAYTIIPYSLHGSGLIRIYRDLGAQPYRLTSMGTALDQRFVEVGVRFYQWAPLSELRPADYAPVKAYLLDKNVRPRYRVVIGLEAVQTHFPLYVNGKRAFFLEPGDSAQIP